MRDHEVEMCKCSVLMAVETKLLLSKCEDRQNLSRVKSQKRDI